MIKTVLAIVAVFVSMIFVPTDVDASFHFWDFNEIYSNVDGTQQFIELTTTSNGQQFVSGHSITSNSDGIVNSFTLTNNTPTPTANRTILFATPDLESVPEFPTPDFIIPSNFFDQTSSTITFNFGSGADIVNIVNGIPSDGLNSVDDNGVIQTATPTNFSGQTATPPFENATITPPVITEPQDDATITVDTVTLTGTADANNTIEVFDGETSLGTATADGSGDWAFITGTLTDGDYIFTATATDGVTTSDPSSAVTITIDTTQIVFVSDRDGNDEIYVMNADGSEQTNISNNPAKDSNPAWSTDGTKIAFGSNRTGTDQIHIMNADGSGVTQVTSGTVRSLAPDWSPDGTKLVYVQSDIEETLFIINTDGTGDTQLTDDTLDNSFPSWSPDGTKIVFEKFVTEGEDDPGEIYVIDIDGTNEVNLTPGQDVLNPNWSSDGSQIFFDKSSTVAREIYVMNFDGTNQIQITNNSVADDDPSGSPDGSKIVFERDFGDEIYVMNFDGTNQIQITNNSALDFDPDWGPNTTDDSPASSFTEWTQAVIDLRNSKPQAFQDTFPIDTDADINRLLAWAGNPVAQMNNSELQEFSHLYSIMKRWNERVDLQNGFPGANLAADPVSLVIWSGRANVLANEFNSDLVPHESTYVLLRYYFLERDDLRNNDVFNGADDGSDPSRLYCFAANSGDSRLTPHQQFYSDNCVL